MAEENKLLKEFADQVADPGDVGTTPGPNIPAQTQLKSDKLGFLESVQRPGYGNNAMADLVKILAMGASGSTAGLPGAAMNFAQIALNPESLRPAVGAGNITEAALGPIFGKLQQLGPVKKALESSPSLMQSLLTGTQGAAQTAADVYDRGGDPVTAAGAGFALGFPFGAAGGMTRRILRNLPSPTGQRIQNALTNYAPLPQDTLKLSAGATDFLQDASTSFQKLEAAEKAGEISGLNEVIAKSANAAAAKKRPVVLGQETIAAEKAAAVANAQTRAKFLATDDVNDAVDYLRLDHPTRAAATKEALASAQTAVDQLNNTPPNVHHFAWYQKRKKAAETALIDAKRQEMEVEQDRLAALEMTRRTERAGRVAAGQTVATNIGATSDAAKAARKAELMAERHRQELKAIDSAGVTAQTRQQVEAAAQGYFTGQMEKILSGHGMAAKDITPNGWRFLANIDPKKNTLSQSLAIASRDRELAEGFHDLLLAKDPDMLRAVRGQFLYDLFEGTRRGEGGANFVKPFSGKELLAKFQGEGKMNPEAINTLFNDKEAFSTIKALAEAAEKADELAKPRRALSAGHVALTGAGTVLFAGAGQLTTDPMKAAALLALAGGGYAVLNIPRFAEAYAKSGSLLGKAISAYIKSPNPSRLPMEVTNMIQGIMTPVAMPGTSDRPGVVAEKAGQKSGFTGGLRY